MLLIRDAALITFGANSVSSTTSDRWLYPSYQNTLAPTIAMYFRLPFKRSGKIRNLRIFHNTPGGNGLNIVYTLQVEAISTLLSVTIPSTSQDGSNLINVASFNPGDRVSLYVQKAASIGASPLDIIASMEVFF